MHELEGNGVLHVFELTWISVRRRRRVARVFLGGGDEIKKKHRAMEPRLVLLRAEVVSLDRNPLIKICEQSR